MMYENGLRTAHGKTNEKGLKVIANYVKINQKPKWMYVYKVVYVRVREPASQDKPVKNKTEKGAIFEALKGRPDYASLRDRKDYATEYDVIWSTKPLFPDKAKGGEATPMEELTFPSLPPLHRPDDSMGQCQDRVGKDDRRASERAIFLGRAERRHRRFHPRHQRFHGPTCTRKRDPERL
jgi:hypothetical protein